MRRHGDLVQDAVDAVADAQIVLERLDVDVRRPLVDRFANDLVDEFDDARLGVIGSDVLRLLALFAIVGAGRSEDLLEGLRADAVNRLDRADELAARDDDPLDLAPGQLLLRQPPGDGIEDVVGRELGGGLGCLERQDLVLEDKAAREHAQRRPIHLAYLNRGHWRLEECGEPGGEFQFINLPCVRGFRRSTYFR